MTRIGKLELRVPRDRNGQFQTAVFERYQRAGAVRGGGAILKPPFGGPGR